MNIVIYFPPSPGCEHDGQIIGSAIAPVLKEVDGKVDFVRARAQTPRSELQKHPTANLDVDCAFFMERILDHPALLKAKHRILIPNPEWLDPQTHALASACTHIWHKSRFSMERLLPVFPRALHAYLGFTSEDPGRLVYGYDSFVHLRGKLATQRSTNSIFTYWRSRRSLPDLHVQFYSTKEEGIQYAGWLSDHNVHVRIGWLERQEQLELAGKHGVHLCTSEVEGYGHYINEARAMGALVITTDGAPMNELVDVNSGILVKPSAISSMHWGTRYLVTPDDLAPAIDQALSLSPQARRALGAAARERFLAEDQLFRRRACELFVKLGQ